MNDVHFEHKVETVKGNARLKKNEKQNQKISDTSDILLTSIKQPKMHEKKVEMYDVYYGMHYDEWTKTRDRFLFSHNMSANT
jgi:hypothetical protein